MLAVSFLGRQAQAVPHPQGDREQHSQHFQHTLAAMGSVPQTLEGNAPGGTITSSGDPVPTLITVMSSSSTSLPETSVMPSSTTGPTVTPFDSIWSVPGTFQAGADSGPIYYMILNNPTLSDGSSLDPVLFVLQTSVPNAMNSSNTWSVAQIPSMFSFPPNLSNSLPKFLSLLR